LVNGRGNLIRRTQVLKTLGVKAGKELPRDMIEMAEADPQEDAGNDDNHISANASSADSLTESV
jgi:hypothetical protein